MPLHQILHVCVPLCSPHKSANCLQLLLRHEAPCVETVSFDVRECGWIDTAGLFEYQEAVSVVRLAFEGIRW